MGGATRYREVAQALGGDILVVLEMVRARRIYKAALKRGRVKLCKLQ